MNRQSILKHFYEFSKVPMSIYKDEKRIERYMDRDFISDIAWYIMNKVGGDSYHSSYTVLMDYMFCGMLKIGESGEYLVIGPSMSFECTSLQANGIAKNLKLPLAMAHNLRSYLNGIPNYHLNQFIALLKTLDGIVNQQLDDPTVLSEKSDDKAVELSNYTNLSYITHVQNDLEKDLLSYVEYGKIKELEIRLKDVFNGGAAFPDFAINQINSAKLIFVNSLALASRAAVKGGLPYDVSMSLSDYYLSCVEEINSKKVFSQLFKKMFIDYTKKTAECQTLKTNSGLVSKINKEIHSYINEKITPSMISNHLHLNVSYLCRHFKMNTGKTISEYINEVKMCEAKLLLTTTDISLLNISIQLGFSSQNYFHKVFKKVVGKTPIEYRNEK